MFSWGKTPKRVCVFLKGETHFMDGSRRSPQCHCHPHSFLPVPGFRGVMGHSCLSDLVPFWDTSDVKMYWALNELQSPECLSLFLASSYVWNDKLCPRTEKLAWKRFWPSGKFWICSLSTNNGFYWLKKKYCLYHFLQSSFCVFLNWSVCMFLKTSPLLRCKWWEFFVFICALQWSSSVTWV